MRSHPCWKHWSAGPCWSFRWRPNSSATLISRNWKRKSAEGLSPLLYVLSCAAHSLWTAHGILQGDRFLIAAQSVGVLTSGIIIFQIFAYRSRVTK